MKHRLNKVRSIEMDLQIPTPGETARRTFMAAPLIAAIVAAGAPPTLANAAALPGIDERVLFVTARGNDANDGLTLQTALATPNAAIAIIGDRGKIQLGMGTINYGNPLRISDGTSIEGISERATALNYTGTGKAITSATPGVRSHNLRLSAFTLTGPGKDTTAVGIDLDSVSDASLTDIVVTKFGVGVAIPSPTNGWSVYNQLRHVTANNCGTGFRVGPVGSNSTMFFGCRANACNIGLDIQDANHVLWTGGAFEANTTGVRVVASANAMADRNTILGARFEGNTTAWNVTSYFVRDFSVLYPSAFAVYTYTDRGTRTDHIGAFPGTNVIRSVARQAWYYERVVSGGVEEPAFLIRDTVTTSGDPVTLQLETERITGYFLRGKRGGQTFFDVSARGVITGGSSNKASRPVARRVGGQWFDTTIGKPIWWNGTRWVDAAGASV